MKCKKIKDPNEPVGKLTTIPDFLPAPQELVPSEETIKKGQPTQKDRTPLEIETLDGKSLQIKPVKGGTVAQSKLKDALERTNKKFGKTLRNLAK